MTVFLTLLVKIIPLYIIVGFGFLAKKIIDLDRDQVAKLLIYFLSPAVVFLGTVQAGLKAELLCLPFLFFFVGAGLLLVTLKIGERIWKDGTEKIAAFSSGTGNTGYFGIPVCLAIVGDEALPIVVMAALGTTFLESTIGYYTVAKTHFDHKNAFKKVITLPNVYAFILGILVNISGIELHSSIISTLDLLKGAYAPLGMMIIGIGLAGVKLIHVDFKLKALTFFNKFVAWPVIFLVVIYLDKNYFHFFNEIVYMVLIIESLTPIAANTVAYASELNAHPEKASVIVLLSTLFALAYVPLMMMFFL